MEGAGAAPAPAQARRGSARTQPIPAALVPVAALLAVAVAAVSLLPSLAQAVWEVPHLFLLGVVVCYGVFAKKSGDAAGGGDGDGGAGRAWNARSYHYHPDDPLVVVDDQASRPGDGEGGVSEKTLSLPVRRLKTAAAQESDASDDGIAEETESSASTTGFWAGARAVPSPPAVLDSGNSRKNDVATPSTMFSDDGEVTDWDDDADQSDEITASPERSFRGDFPACGNHGNGGYNGDGDGHSVDDELFELATKAGPEGEDEVDRKADAFIAKFREQIRLQRLEPAMTT